MHLRHLTRLLVLAAPGLVSCNSVFVNGTSVGRYDRAAREGAPTARQTLPSKHAFRVSQFTFLHDFDLNREQPIFRELAELREQVFQVLKLPHSSKLIKVYLFEDQDRYEAFMRVTYPDLPRRRAFFVAQPGGVGVGEELLVFTFWGKRVREDLRHELTHAMLHSVLKDVPLWLDEGIAEYFEVPAEFKGVNAVHLEQMKRGAPPQPNLPRLESLNAVDDMTPGEYGESWAWVHLMLHDKPEAQNVLINYLQHLRNNPHAPPLSAQLAVVYPSANEALLNHVGKLQLFRKLPHLQSSPRIE